MKLTTELQAIAYMISGAFWFTAMTAIVRHLSDDMHPYQIVFFRNAFALAIMLPWVYQAGITSLRTKQWMLYSVRGVNGLGAMLLWFLALSLIPLPVAVSLSFTTPLFTTLAAIFFLQERVGKHRWIALVIGFIGTLIILRPGVGEFNFAFLLVLIDSVLWAVSNIIIKRLTKTETPLSIVFYMTLIMTPLSIPFAIPYWQPVSLSQYGWLILLGIVSNLAQLSIGYAYGKADMSVLQPFDFFRLIFASFIAFFAFGDVLDIWTLIGAIVIMASSVYITHREARIRRRKREEDMLMEMEEI